MNSLVFHDFAQSQIAFPAPSGFLEALSHTYSNDSSAPRMAWRDSAVMDASPRVAFTILTSGISVEYDLNGSLSSLNESSWRMVMDVILEFDWRFFASWNPGMEWFKK